MKEPHPNFFIVGAPRCGTTALAHYLGQHPEIFLAPIKEMHHFGRDVLNRPEFKDRGRYLAEFQPGEGKKRLGEASVWYLYSESAPVEMKEFEPESRIIIMLRNPVDMIYSLHARLLLLETETEPDFRKALDLEEKRRAEARLPDGRLLLRPWFYREIGRFSPYVERYLQVFGRHQVHVIIFDDFRRDLAGVFRQILTFLEVEPDVSPSFERINENRRLRSPALHRFLRRMPPAAWKLRRLLLPENFHPGRMLMNLNAPPAPLPPLPGGLRRTLEEEFTPDVEKLSRLLGRNLFAEWNMPTAGGSRHEVRTEERKKE